MSAELVVGPPGCGKTRYVLEHYRQCVERHGHDAALLLVPTQRVADTVRGRLLDEGGLEGLFDFRVMTFNDAAGLMLVANHAPVSLVSDVQRAVVLQRVLEEMSAEQLGPLADHIDRPGLVTALLEDIDEFKAAGIEPEALVTTLEQATSATEQERAVARVYREYQAVMRELGIYDRPGTLWAALELLREGRDKPWERLRLVAADGFSDFTTVQAQTLRHLAELAGECIITLTMVPEPDRLELRRLPERTIEMIRDVFGAEVEVRQTMLSYRGAPSSDREYVVAHFFNPLVEAREPGPEGRDGSVQVFEAPGIWAEVRMVAREVKRLLLRPDEGEQTKPERIGIIARTLEPYEEALRQVFAEYQVPLFVARGRPLTASPVARPVLGLLMVVAADFPRIDVIELWRSSYLDLEGIAGPNYATAEEADVISRRAGVVGGKEQWLRALDRLEERATRALEGGEERERESDYVSRKDMEWVLDTLPRVRTTFKALAELLGPLQQPRPRAEMVAAFFDVLRRLGIADRVVQSDADFVAGDLRAWNAIVASLREMMDAESFAGARAGETVDIGDFAAEVQQVLSSTRIHPEGRGEGRVVAMTAADALQTDLDYVFLIGLTEGSFPLVRAPDPLIADECRWELARQHLPVRLREAAQEEEAYLFYLLMGLARRRVYLCYPTSDAEGEPLLRSAYVDEVLRLVPEPPTKRMELKDVIPPMEDTGGGRELIEAVLWAEYHGGGAPEQLRAARAALERDARWRPAAMQAFLGARVEKVRDGWDAEAGSGGQPAPLGAFDGVLSDPEAVEYVAAKFGDRHWFSTDELNKYAACPMAFFFERLLGLGDLDEPAEDVTTREVGQLLHTILRKFYERRLERGAGHVAGEATEEGRRRALEELMEAAEEAFAIYEQRQLTAHQKLWEVTKEVVRRRLETWLEAEIEIPARLGIEELPQPAHLEWAYSPAKGNGLVLSLPEVGDVIFRGRIDRVDEVGDDGFVVYDYKRSPSGSKKAQQEGQDFQLVLYALAGERVLYGGKRRCVAWAYVGVGQPADKALKGAARGAEQVQEIVEDAQVMAGAHIAQIRSGWFGWPDQCPGPQRCSFATICRYSIERARARKRLADGGGSR